MKYRHRVLTLLFFLSIVTYIDRVCIAVAGPRMQKELDLGPELWGWVVGAFTLSYAIFEIPTGAWGDKFGQRRVLARIVLWWSVFTSLTGEVRNFTQLLVCRFLFGAGEAGAYPNSSGAIGRWFPAVERARASGVVWMASRLGGALSPLLVVPIVQTLGWRWAFHIFGAIGFLWVAVWLWWFRDTPSEKKGITQAELEEIGHTPGAQHESMPWSIALRSRNFWIILAMYHTYCWGSYFYLSWLPTYLVKGRGLSETEMQFLAPWPFILGACGNLFGGWLSDKLGTRYGRRTGRRTVGAIGLGLSGIFMLSCALSPGKILPVVFLSLGYMSMDCMLPVAWAVCLDVGRKYAGAMTGSMNMAGQFGSFISSLAFGYIVKYFGSYDLPLFPFSGFLIVSALLFTRIDPEEQLVPELPANSPAPQPQAA